MRLLRKIQTFHLSIPNIYRTIPRKNPKESMQSPDPQLHPAEPLRRLTRRPPNPASAHHAPYLSLALRPRSAVSHASTTDTRTTTAHPQSKHRHFPVASLQNSAENQSKTSRFGGASGALQGRFLRPAHPILKL
jgi:hypothetical protein